MQPPIDGMLGDESLLGASDDERHGLTEHLPGNDVAAEVNATPDARFTCLRGPREDCIGRGGELVGEHVGNRT